MTRAAHSPVTRETAAAVRDRGVRLKGCRIRYLLPYEVAFWRAARLAAEQARDPGPLPAAEKRAARKVR